jgi:Fe-S-cluster containining protein
MKGKPAPAGFMNINTEGLSKLMRRAPFRERVKMETLHRELQQAFTAALVPPENEPAGVMLGIFKYVDEAVEQMKLHDKSAPDIKCRRGCSACCHLHVSVTRPEAEIALEAAQDAAWPIDMELLRTQATRRDDKEWQDLPHELRPCVFLTPAGVCAIYEYRPLACRRYFVVSDPADCDSLHKPGQEVLQLVDVHSEIASSAALEVFESGTFAAMLLAELERERHADE